MRVGADAGGSSVMVRALVVAVVAALVVTLPNVLASAVDRNPGVDVSVVRITHGARVVAPGERVLLSATVMNRGDRATSAGEPLVVAARDLPAGVTLAPGDPAQPGLSCGPDACEYRTPVEPDKILSLPLVARVDRSVAAGTPVAFDLVADSVSDVDDTTAASPVRFRVGRSRGDLARVHVSPVTPLAVGHRATLHARVFTVAGTAARRPTVSQLLPSSLLRKVRTSGHGWRCRDGVRRCRVAATLPVGRASATLTITGIVRRQRHATDLARQSRASGRYGTVDWRSVVRSSGSPSRRQHQSLVVRTAKPRAAKPPRAAAVPDWTTTAHLEAALTPLGEVRPRGSVRFAARVLHNGVGRARHSRLVVGLPKGFRVTSISDGAWRCRTTDRSARCRLRRAVDRRTAAPRVILTTRVGRHVATDVPAPRMAVTWRVGHHRYRDTDRSSVQVIAPLRVRAHASDRSVLTGGRGKSVMLQADILGTDPRSRPAYRWQQLSGPRVRWRGPQAQAHGPTHVTTRFAVPRVRRAATLRFRFTAGAHGARASDVISIRVRARHTAALPARRAHIHAPGPIPDRSDWRGRRVRPAATITIGRPGATLIRAGSRRRLHAAVSGHHVRKRWRVLSGSDRMLRGSRRGSSVTLRAPRRPGLYSVGLRVKDRRGRHVHRAEIIRVVAPERSSLGVSATASGFCSRFATAASGSSVGKIAIGGGGSLVPGGVTVSGSTCSAAGAALDFTDATLTFGTHTFAGVAGSLTAAGLTVDSGTYDLPGSWAQALSFLDDPSLDFTTDGDVTASWAGSSLGPLAGSVSLPEFLFLELPGGWTGTTTVAFTPGAAHPLSLDASAADGSGADRSGSVELTGWVALDGTFSVDTQVANIVLPAGDGSQATVSGGGSIGLAKAGGAVAYQLQAALDGPVDLFPEFSLTSAGLTWDDTGITVSGAGQISADGDTVPVSLTGTYDGDADWSLAASQTGPWQSPDVTVSDLSGTVAYAQQVLTFSVSGAAQNVDLPDGVTATSLTAQVTNQCPTSGCSTGDLRLIVDAVGTISAGGSTDDYSGTVDVDLDTMDLTFDATVSGQFGPADFPLTDVTLSSGPGSSGTCAPAAGAGQVTTFTATIADAFGDEDIDVVGDLSSAGYCFAANLDQFSPTGDPTTDNSFDDVTLLYSSYATTAFVPGVADPVAVPAETAGVYGTFTAPSAMSGALGGLSGSGVFQAVITDGADGLGFSGSVSYSLADSLYLMGSATSSPAVSLDQVSLTVDLAADEFEIDLVGSGDLDVGGSDMPLAVGVDVDLVDLTFGFSATVAGGDPVADAFGYQGLDLQNLAVAGAVGGDPELAFAAAADLPSDWDNSLGVQPRTPISLAVDLSATPCLQFSVGQADQTVAAVDFMNEGVLVADYANLVLAPVGCQFADVTIAPGFALDFDGFVSGDPVDFNSSLTLGDSGFALTASLSVGEFDLGGTTTLTDTSFDLDLDPAADVFSIDVSATVDVAGNSLAISGDYDQTGPGAVTASFQASTSGAVSVAGFDFDDATVSLTYRDSSAGSALSFTLDGDVSFLDQSLDGTLALTAANGAVVSASGNLDVSVDLDIVTVTGPLQFSYRAGQGATAQFGPGTVDAFGAQFTGVTGSLQPDGSYAIRAVTGIPEQNASAADAWLYANEGGEFNTTFFGELDVTIAGGNGQPAAVGYQGSWVAMSSEWAEHTWDSYGDDVALPAPGDGCPAPFVAGDGVAGTPAANFWLNPVATEQASTGDSDDDDNYCIPFQSQIL